MVIFYVFDSKTEQLSGEALSISSERIFKDVRAWRAGSLLMSRKSGDTGIHTAEEEAAGSSFDCVLCDTLNSRVHQDGAGNGISEQEIGNVGAPWRSLTI